MVTPYLITYWKMKKIYRLRKGGSKLIVLGGYPSSLGDHATLMTYKGKKMKKLFSLLMDFLSPKFKINIDFDWLVCILRSLQLVSLPPPLVSYFAYTSDKFYFKYYHNLVINFRNFFFFFLRK